MLNCGDFGFYYFFLMNVVFFFSQFFFFFGDGDARLELQTSNSIQIGFKCVYMQELPMNCQFATFSLVLVFSWEAFSLFHTSLIQRSVRDVGGQTLEICSLVLSFAGFPYSLQHSQFSGFNFLFSHIRNSFFPYNNPSQVWTAVSLRLKTAKLGIYLSPFLYVNLHC